MPCSPSPCLVGRVVSTRAYGSNDRGSVPRAGGTHIVFRERFKTVEAVLEHDARYTSLSYR